MQGVMERRHVDSSFPRRLKHLCTILEGKAGLVALAGSTALAATEAIYGSIVASNIWRGLTIEFPASDETGAANH